jgi:hypothetical protein
VTGVLLKEEKKREIARTWEEVRVGRKVER